MAVGFVQGNWSSPGGTNSTIAVAFTGNVTAGDLLFVSSIINVSTGGNATFTDSQGNSYSATTYNTVGGLKFAQSAAIAGTPGPNTVTVTYQFAQSFTELFIAEFNIGGNALAIDGTAATSSDAGTSFASAAITTTNNPDILICFIANNGSLSGLSAGWSSPASIFDSGGEGLAYKVSGTAGPYSLTATQPAGGDSSCIYAYKATSSVTDINATAALAPDTVLTLGAQLAQKDVATFLPGTILTLTTLLTEPDTVALAPQVLLALNADVLEEAVMATTPATTLAITASIQNIDLNAATSIAPGTTATLIPGAGISATIFI